MKIIILGMHRSGTSMLGGVLHKLGFFAGDEADFLPPAPDNPKGFWERIDVKELNDQLLDHKGYKWWKVSGLSQSEFKTFVDEEIEQEADRIIQKLDQTKDWFIKDPRLCLVNDFWKSKINNPIYLVMFREPAHVAVSLNKRNGFSLNYSLALWQKYTMELLSSIDPNRTILVNYSKFLSNTEGESDLLVKGLKVLSSDMHQLEDAHRAMEIVSPELNRSGQELDMLDAWLNEDQQHLVDLLRQGSIELAVRLVGELNHSALDTMLASQELVYSQQRALQRHLIIAKDKDTSIIELRDQVSILDAALKSEQAQVSDLLETKRNLGEQLSAIQTEKLELEHNLSEKSKAVINLKLRSEALEKAKNVLEVQEDGLRSRILTLEEDAIEAQQKLKNEQRIVTKMIVRRRERMLKILQDLEENYLLFGESWRWKLGNKVISIVEYLLGRKNVELTIDKIPIQIEQVRNQLRELPTPRGRLGGGEKVNLNYLASDAGETRSFSSDKSGLFIEKEARLQDSFVLASQFNSPIRITIVTPSTNIHGGTKRLLTLASLLHERGHKVSFVRQYKSRRLDWFDLPLPVLDIWFREDTPLDELRKKLPDADVLITYGNNKANALLEHLPPSKGLKFSLFMHFGVHDRKLDVQNAKLVGLRLLATTNWIAKQLANYGHTRRIGTIGFGVYPEQFYPTNAKRDFKIGTLWHDLPWKNSEKVVDAYRSIRRQEKFKNLKLILFGQDSHFESNDPLITYVRDPSQQDLREIYSSCSAWIVASEFEGIGMCGVEAMLCKTPLITTDTGGSSDFCNPDNSFLLKSATTKEITRSIEYIFEHPEIAVQKARKAYRDIASHTWSQSIDRLELGLKNELHRDNPILIDGKPVDLTIGIPCHNHGSVVSKCLESIGVCTEVSFEIILIDDGSDLANQVLIEKLAAEYNARLIRHDEPQGLSHNYNRIVLQAQGTYVCLLDSDTLVTKGWDTQMMEEFVRDPMLAMVGPSTSYGKAKNGDKIVQVLPEYEEGRQSVGLEEAALIAQEVALMYDDVFEETEYLNGFCMMIHSKVFSEVGLFDPMFGLGTREDVQFIDRLRSSGYSVGWKKGAYVHHFGHTSFRGMKGFSDLLAKNKKFYYDTKGKRTDLLKTNQRVLFVFTNQSSSNRKRTFEPLKILSRFVYVKALHFGAVDEGVIDGYDVIILQRLGALNHVIDRSVLEKILGWIKKFESKTFVYDIDDFLPHSQNGVPRKLMESVDLVTTTCHHLASLLVRYNSRVVVIPNAFDWHRYVRACGDQAPNEGSKKVVSFSLGGAGIDEMHRLALLLKPMNFEMLFISSAVANVDDYPALSILPNLELDELFGLLSTCDYVINWGTHSEDYFDVLKERYALRDEEKDDFINSKSGLKYYCAAAARAIFLSSSTPVVYSELVQNGKNGYLVEDADTCYYIIKQLEENEKLREEIKLTAYRDLISNYCLDSMAYNWLTLLKTLEQKGGDATAHYQSPDLQLEEPLSLSKLLDLEESRKPHTLEFDGVPSVDIIVPVHNALSDTVRCINSVVNSTIVPYRLIVVDDLSNEETATYLSSHKGSNYIYVRNKINSGFTKSVNVGSSYAISPVQVVLNSDTVVPVGWLDKILEAFEADKSVAVVGCVSNAASFQSLPYVSDPSTGDWYIEAPPIELSLWSSLVEFLAHPVQCPEFPIVNGFCLAVRKEVVDQVGGFDEENFPHGYGEENDFCVRVGKAGFKLVVREDCFVYHAKSKSFTHERRKKLSAEGSKALKAKHGKETIAKLVEILKNENPLDPLRTRMQDLLRSDREPSIAYILPSKTLGGGVISVLQACETLGILGKDANVIIPYQLKPKVEINFDISATKIYTYTDKKDIGSIGAQFDILVATHNSSVKYVQQAIDLADHRIRPFYFVQDYEPRFYKEGSDFWKEALGSYEAIPGMVSYAKTGFLCETVKQHHPKVDIRKIRPGFNLGLYRPSLQNIFRRKEEGVFALTAMLRPTTARRAPQMVVDVCKQLLADNPTGKDVQIHFFGCTVEEIEEFSIEVDIPHTNHGILAPEKVFELLVASDAFLDMSTYQGFGRTGLEAMAAGCVPILPANCGPDEYASDTNDCFLVDTSTTNEALEKLKMLCADDSLLLRMKKMGLRTASRYDLVSDCLDQYSIFCEQGTK